MTVIRPIRIYLLTVVFLFFSIFGCSSGTAVSSQQAAVKDPAPDVKIFSAGKSRMYPMSVSAMQKLGYVVTVSDPATGILTAERFMSSPILEDPANITIPEKKTTAGDVLLVLLSIVLIFGIVFIIIDAASSSDKEKNESADSKRSQNDHHQHHKDSEVTPSPTMGYKYTLSLRFAALSDSATRIQTIVTKVTYSNGSPVSSTVISSSAILNELYRSFENEIFLAP